MYTFLEGFSIGANWNHAVLMWVSITSLNVASCAESHQRRTVSGMHLTAPKWVELMSDRLQSEANGGFLSPFLVQFCHHVFTNK